MALRQDVSADAGDFSGLALYQSTDSSGGAVWMLYPIFFAGTLPASLIGDDEKSGWQSCCDTLPVTRRQIVTVKYITCLVTAAAVCLLAVPVVLLRHDTVAAMPFLAMMAPVGLIVPSVMLPTTYKLGATKGRVVYIVMLMVMAGVCVLLVNLSKESARRPRCLRWRLRPSRWRCSSAAGRCP